MRLPTGTSHWAFEFVGLKKFYTVLNSYQQGCGKLGGKCG